MVPISNLKANQNKPKVIMDLNCDLAQSFGVYKNDIEYSLLPYVSTVNISCGAHAGDPIAIMEALDTIQNKNIALCAHIGYPDLQGFGYREMSLTKDQMESMVLYQLGALSAMAKAHHMDIEYVRPHGALYKQAAENYEVSYYIADAIKRFNPWLIYIGASCPELDAVQEETEVRVAHEFMPEKVYTVEGRIDFSKAPVYDEEEILSQVELALHKSSVRNEERSLSSIKCDTIHLNTKSHNALAIAEKIYGMIDEVSPVALNKVSSAGWID